jgi:hypothetical protein
LFCKSSAAPVFFQKIKHFRNSHSQYHYSTTRKDSSRAEIVMIGWKYVKGSLYSVSCQIL